MKRVVAYKLYPAGRTYRGIAGEGREVWQREFDIPGYDEAQALAGDIISRMDSTEGVPLEITIWYDPTTAQLSYIAYVTTFEALTAQSADYQVQIDPLSALAAITALVGAIAGLLLAISWFQVASVVTTSVKGTSWAWVPLVAIVAAGGYLFSKAMPLFQGKSSRPWF